MGLADRDYMRDRHSQAQPRQRFNAPLPSPNRVRNGVITVGALALLTWSIVHYLDTRKPAVPFPATGELRWFVPPPEADAAAPLTISAPRDASLNFAVKLSEWNSGKPVVIVPIRGAETATVQVPLGEFRITIASGKTWHGTETLFGRGGEVREAVAPMHFYKTKSQTHGHRIDLQKRVDGNLQTRPAGSF